MARSSDTAHTSCKQPCASSLLALIVLSYLTSQDSPDMWRCFPGRPRKGEPEPVTKLPSPASGRSVLVMAITSDGRLWEWDVLLPKYPARTFLASCDGRPLTAMAASLEVNSWGFGGRGGRRLANSHSNSTRAAVGKSARHSKNQ
jgi:hypothetical protein